MEIHDVPLCKAVRCRAESNLVHFEPSAPNLLGEADTGAAFCPFRLFFRHLFQYVRQNVTLLLRLMRPEYVVVAWTVRIRMSSRVHLILIMHLITDLSARMYFLGIVI
jgi:hypothetical protein